MRPPPQLIGLTGYAGSGKDTVREMLELVGYHGFAFADAIREMIYALIVQNGIDDKYMNSREFKEAVIPELGVSYRQMAQTLGTEWGRALNEDFWLRLAGAYMTRAATQDSYSRELCEAQGIPPANEASFFVISDVRFANEAAWVRERGGIIWRIERPQAVPVRAHASESEIYHIVPDAVIDNSGSMDALGSAVVRALNGTL
jgi:hypothetical protein